MAAIARFVRAIGTAFPRRTAPRTNGETTMLENKDDALFCDYYKRWVKVYKEVQFVM